MKKLLVVLLVLMATSLLGNAQQINLGPNTPIQVKGVLQQIYGGTGTNVSTPSCFGTGHALQWNPTASPPQYQCYTFVTGGTVTQVSPTGTNSMFVLGVANQTTTPQISISLSDAINQIFVGTGTGTGIWTTIPNCAGGLTYNTSLQTFGCFSGGGITANALTAAASGGAGPGTSFNGSAAITYDYHSFGAPSATGTGASGTWPISISGQAGTVVGSVTFNNGGSGGSSPEVFNGSSSFTVSYNTIGAPSVTGTGASGTWAIAISGNAATATQFASAPSDCSIGEWSYGISINGNAVCGSANVTITLPSGSVIGANTCTGTSTQALTGVRSTSAFDTAFGSNPTAVNGWGSAGGLVVEIWPDASNDIFDWAVCNQASTPITPGAMTLNVGVK